MVESEGEEEQFINSNKDNSYFDELDEIESYNSELDYSNESEYEYNDYLPDPIEKDFKTILKNLEKTTIRCFICNIIPRISINFSKFKIKLDCNKEHYYYYRPLDIIKELNKCNNNENNNNKKSDKSEIDTDKYCIFHKKPIEYVLNLCEECEYIYNDYSELKDFFENPLKKIKIKDLSNFLFTKDELENLKKKINYVESQLNSLNLSDDAIYLFINYKKKNKIIMIYFIISLMRSFIYTYEEMIKNNYLNYNIIYNLRKINIEDNFDVKKYICLVENYNLYFPFYNISMNKYLMQYISKETNSDEFIEKIHINFKIPKNFKNINYYYSSYYNIYLSFDKNQIIFLKENKKSLILNKKNYYLLKKYLKETKIVSIYNSNLLLMIEDHNISIKQYLISNAKKCELLDYQSINIEQAEDFSLKNITSIFQDKDGSNIYILYNLEFITYLIIISKDKNNFYYLKQKLTFDRNKYSHFFILNQKMYIIEKNWDFVEINLNTLKQRSLNFSVLDKILLKYSFFISIIVEINEAHLMVIISTKDYTGYSFIIFIKKNDFLLEDKIYKLEYHFEYNHRIYLLKDNYFIIEEKDNDSHLDNSYYFYKISEKLDIIKLNEYKPKIPKNFDFYSTDENENEYDNDYPDNKELIEKYSKLKNKIMKCPYCPLILNVENFFFKYEEIPEKLESYLFFDCEIHGKIELDLRKESITCVFCGNNENLFYTYSLDFYLCKYCLNKYIKTKMKIKKKYGCLNYKLFYKRLKVADVKKGDTLCYQHLKKIKYTFNMCKYCKYLDNKYFNKYNNSDLDILFEGKPEKLSNIDFSDEEMEDFKSNLKIIEKKINKLKNKETKYYLGIFCQLCIIQSILHTYEIFKKENKLNYTIIKNLRKIKLNPNFNIKNNETIFFKVNIHKFLYGEIKNIKNNNKFDFYEEINLDKLIEKEGPLTYENLYKFIENKDIIIYQDPYEIIYIYSKIHKKDKIENNLNSFISYTNIKYEIDEELEVMQNNNFNFITTKCYLLKDLNFFIILNLSEIIFLKYKVFSENNIIFEHYKTLKLFINSPNFIRKKIEYVEFDAYDTKHYYNEPKVIFEDKDKIYGFKKQYFFIIRKFINEMNNLEFDIENVVWIEPDYINYEKYNDKIYFLYKSFIKEIDLNIFNERKIDLNTEKIGEYNYYLKDDLINIDNKYILLNNCLINKDNNSIEEIRNIYIDGFYMFKVPKENIIILYRNEEFLLLKIEDNNLQYMNFYHNNYDGNPDGKRIYRNNEKIYLYFSRELYIEDGNRNFKKHEKYSIFEFPFIN